MAVSPYLFFEGRCEEALAFYKKALGAEVTMLMRYSDSPEPPGMPLPAGSESKVMHSAFTVQGTLLMGSDGLCSGKPAFGGFCLSLDAKDEAEARLLFDALAEGGQVQMPLGKTFWSQCFGMVTDRFGMGWMVGTAH